MRKVAFVQIAEPRASTQWWVWCTVPVAALRGWEIGALNVDRIDSSYCRAIMLQSECLGGMKATVEPMLGSMKEPDRRSVSVVCRQQRE